MRKILFPLYMNADKDDFSFYEQAFVKEGFQFARAVEEKLLLRADAMVLYGNEAIMLDETKASLIKTAKERDIPIILLRADQIPSLRETEGVIDAAKISFSSLKELIDERQKDIFRKVEEPSKGSRFLNLFAIMITALLAGLLIWKGASLTFDTETVSPQAQRISRQTELAVVRVYAIGSMNDEAWRGCGFAVNDDGYIVTNAHVVDHYAVSYYVMYRENRYEAEVIRISEDEDIALIHIDTLTHFNLRFADSPPEKDDPLYTVGYPGNQKLTVLEGKALGDKIRFEQGISYMPIQMALKSGISGSPVLDSEGRVAGIASAVSTQDENLSFMVSSDTAKDFLKDYLFIDD